MSSCLSAPIVRPSRITDYVAVDANSVSRRSDIHKSNEKGRGDQKANYCWSLTLVPLADLSGAEACLLA